MNTLIKIAIICTLIFITVFFCVLLFTLTVILISDQSLDNFAKFGDSFNGILGPGIALLSALLVYFALRAQIKANKIISEQFDAQSFTTFVNSQLSNIREDINSFESEKDSASKVINNYIFHSYDPKRCGACNQIHLDSLSKIKDILYRINHLLIEVNKRKKQSDLFYLLMSIRSIYVFGIRQAIKDSILNVIDNNGVCTNCKRKHGNVRFKLAEIFQAIEKHLEDIVENDTHQVLDVSDPNPANRTMIQTVTVSKPLKV